MLLVSFRLLNFNQADSTLDFYCIFFNEQTSEKNTSRTVGLHGDPPGLRSEAPTGFPYILSAKSFFSTSSSSISSRITINSHGPPEKVRGHAYRTVSRDDYVSASFQVTETRPPDDCRFSQTSRYRRSRSRGVTNRCRKGALAPSQYFSPSPGIHSRAKASSGGGRAQERVPPGEEAGV